MAKRKRRRKGPKTAQQRKFAAAAKSCGGKGLSKTKFRACVKKKLRKGR